MPTEKSAAAFKKDSAAKPANSFPSMEDQLKDLLKGNSEESLIAPGHNSTRFHLDYTNAGEHTHIFFGQGRKEVKGKGTEKYLLNYGFLFVRY